ncbi:MAG TPA: translation initiation factor IF-2 [Candidatus Paceibacterota bacterium]|nr:translation initiation factor IF-2 [Candidatus Paceibacterota bacterium]
MEPTLQERPPIVAVLGHVDHGKSTLLDFIRKANVVAGEHGGITQHVAAYEVVHEHEGKQKRITFIDTPGHAAFQAIRSRGARVADIAILVVAADDGVKAQTLEALQSIRDAGIPFIVAINKIDKPNADIARTQNSIMEQGVYLEKLGGDVPWTAISAKTGTGVDELLDLILIVAELQEFKADAAVPASGFVIEAHRDQKRGIAATLIITKGTLKKGMAVLAGRSVAPVRLMEDHLGADLSKASFSTPVVLVGFDELPEAGAEFQAFKNKKEAEAARPQAQAVLGKIAEVTSEEKFLLPVIVRVDVAGSLEALEHELPKIGDAFRGVSLVQSGIGDISETDIKAALAAHISTVFGFNVRIDREAETLARQNGITFERFNIIYKLTERIEELMRAQAPRRTEEIITGRAKLLKVFSSRKDEHLVGGKVIDGEIAKKAKLVLKRAHVEIARGEVLSIQSAKRTVDKVEAGTEFGAQIVSEIEPHEGDIIECVTIKEL